MLIYCIYLIFLIWYLHSSKASWTFWRDFIASIWFIYNWKMLQCQQFVFERDDCIRTIACAKGTLQNQAGAIPLEKTWCWWVCCFSLSLYCILFVIFMSRCIEDYVACFEVLYLCCIIIFILLIPLAWKKLWIDFINMDFQVRGCFTALFCCKLSILHDTFNLSLLLGFCFYGQHLRVLLSHA